jgi:hypothetical protein
VLADDDVYVYRDTSEPPGYPAAATPRPGSDEDASYWYDLSEQDSAARPAETVRAETRGPFEPLVSSSGPPSARPLPSEDGPTAPGAGDDEDSAHARARKLEQIKDFYLTAEAIGDHNVDKHFDQLLAQQRELISEYFRSSEAAKPPGGLAAQTGTQTGTQAGTQAGTQPPAQARSRAGTPGGADPDAVPEASAVAEQPRAW